MGKKYTLLKELCPKRVQENSFEAGGGGVSGTLNYQTGYGTPAGGNYSQDPGHFNTKGTFSSNGTESPNHLAGQESGSALNPLPDRGLQGVDKNSLGGEPSPQDKADTAKSQTPLNPDQAYDKDVNQIFKKKDTPTPDEIMSAIQYELGKMVKKDKTIAKRMVLKNLKQNPHYYSELDMLNIDDKKMKVDESQVAKTKAVLDEMIAARQSRIAPPPPYLDQIFQGLHDKRHGISRTQPEEK